MSAPHTMSGVAVVTGAAGGMGSHIARRLHRDGFRVMVTDLDDAVVTDLARELSADGSTCTHRRLDVSRPEDFRGALEQARSIWAEPTVLVNNAAVTRAADTMTLSSAEFTDVLSLNSAGVFNGCQVFGEAMAAHGFGRIINMASLAGQNGGTATGAHYAASKGAILTLTKVFARSLAAQGVTVNAISPGPHDLPVVHRTVPADALEAVTSSIPVGRLGDPSFIADTVALLAQENAGFVTGACWDVNGGLHLR
ncbi:SDR family NAD(P)-dependent oxidoreductase [Janibacter sp. GS2]|uniref:SDR family NAD(P)-dependent oxidoreductase n=1 Tax=Janibacter sp. GS2 TaxID=3442646 RepID=UPI003EBACE72